MKLTAAAGVTTLAAAGLFWHGLSVTPAVEARELPAIREVTQGALLIRDTDGKPRLECPLKRTDVNAEISGFLARVTVTQEFENTATDKVEAVYVFPLPHNAAVDSMTLHVGARTVKGAIKKREEARAIYEAARDAGRVAALLDQERPNIFTQSVANIMPGEKIRVVISYVERLKYEAGTYEFVFPMVVGPRYIPGKPVGKLGGGWAYDTDRVPDASRITPPVAKPGTRAGHDISVQVTLDAGVPIDGLVSALHEVEIARPGTSRATVRLKNRQEIPNKDFILRYDVAGGKIQDAVLTHRADRGGFFTLILQPPDKLNVQDVTPKELVFVLDTSGSMNGFPIEKAKESMRLAIDGLNPHDTFNLITFAGDTHILFPQPVPASRENVRRAQEFLASRQGAGGTEMMKAIRAALARSESDKHVRIVCFMTDGYVGNEMEIINEIRTHSNARVFSFGIGNSVNRWLLDKMAEAGRGEVEYVSLRDDGSAAARRFHERIRNPLLTDISIEWNGLPVTDVIPQRIPDLFSAKPVVVTGRYSAPAKGTIRLRGTLAGAPISRQITVDLPATEQRHDVLASLWARTKIDSLMHEPNSRDQITQLGLDYKLMTMFTSFVAVEETVITEGGKPRRVDVPVDIPDGVSYEGIFGAEADMNVHPAAKAVRQTFIGGAVAAAPPSAGKLMTLDRAAASEVRREDGPRQKETKLDAALSGPALAKLTVDGKVRIMVWLKSADAKTLAALKQLGLEVLGRPATANVVIGRIAADKLEALSKLAEVTRITPAP
jgi:Ca-activated chloride channel family protein